MRKTAILLLFCSTALHAATITVCADGCDQATIAAGLGAAGSGDTVLVSPGTYDERPLTVPAGATLASRDGSGLTKIYPTVMGTPDATTPIVALGSGSTLRGFDLFIPEVNDSGNPKGLGVQISGPNATVEQCKIGGGCDHVRWDNAANGGTVKILRNYFYGPCWDIACAGAGATGPDHTCIVYIYGNTCRATIHSGLNTSGAAFYSRQRQSLESVHIYFNDVEMTGHAASNSVLSFVDDRNPKTAFGATSRIYSGFNRVRLVQAHATAKTAGFWFNRVFGSAGYAADIVSESDDIVITGTAAYWAAGYTSYTNTYYGTLEIRGGNPNPTLFNSVNGASQPVVRITDMNYFPRLKHGNIGSGGMHGPE